MTIHQQINPIHNLAAVIIETRDIENLDLIIRNHMTFLPEYTKLYLFAKKDIENIGDHYFIQLHNDLDDDKINYFMTSRKFWDKIKQENILIFQWDSIILRHGIEKYIGWDFIGSPIAGEPASVMNGGLSLRKKSAMLWVIDYCEKYSIDIHEHEDGYFCRQLSRYGFSIPHNNYENDFSIDNVFRLGTFGAHGNGCRLEPEQWEQIKNQYK